MPPRAGYLIRPLLSLDRGLIRRMLGGLTEFAEDPTNRDQSFARNRIRLEVMPELERINSAAELNIVRTREELAEDEEALMQVATAVIAAEGRAGSGGSREVSGRSLGEQPPAVRRRMIRHLAETELGRPVAVSPALAADALRLAGDPEGGRLDLGGGDFLLIEAGWVRACPGGGTGHEAVPEPVRIDLEAGAASFGGWEIESSRGAEAEVRPEFGNPWAAFLDSDQLLEWLIEASPGADDLLLQARPWRSGDRVEPLGMSGSKSLQDVFTDALVPASRRRSWPVLDVAGKVIWVPGLVRSRHLLVGGPDKQVLRLYARPPFPI
jgi:tRNA(Ile)-lysidine synthase